jgi:MFS family permease
MTLPEPAVEPALLETIPAVEREPRSRVGQRRLGFALFIAATVVFFSVGGLTGNVLAAKFAILDPANKTTLYGLATTLYAIAATISLILGGTISDLTRSRFGARSPWLVVGAVLGGLTLVGAGLTQSTTLLLVLAPVFGLTYGILPAILVAIFPDRVPVGRRGSVSAVYGSGQVIGAVIGGSLGAQFLVVPDTFIFATAVVLVIGVLLFVVLAPDYSNKDEPRRRLDLRGVVASFAFPRKAPDFYWAYAGRFLLLFGVYMITNYILYIVTDYIGVPADQAGGIVASVALVGLVPLIIGTVVGGPLSDRLGRRKAPLFAAALLFGVAIAIPLIWPTPVALIVFSAVAGLGQGAFFSIDTALMTEVIPSDASRGKDLAILTTANTIPQVLAPGATALVVGAMGYPPIFVIALVCVAVGAASIWFIRGIR